MWALETIISENDATMKETDQSTPRRKALKGYEEFQKPIITWLMVKTVLSAGCLARSGMSSGDCEVGKRSRWYRQMG